MTDSEKLKVLVVSREPKFLSKVHSYLSEMPLELIPADLDWFTEPTSDRTEVAAVFLASDWRSPASLEFLERYRSTWQGWYALQFVVDPNITDQEQEICAGLGVSSFLDEKDMVKQRPKVVSEIYHRIKLKNSFENLFDNFSTALSSLDLFRVRHSVEALVFFDELMFPLVSRVLISLMRGNEDVMPIVKRLQSTVGEHIELDLCLLVHRMLSSKPLSGQLRKFVEKHGAEQLIFRCVLGGFHFSQSQVQGQSYDFFDTAFRSCWGDSFTEFFFSHLHRKLQSEDKLDRYDELLGLMQGNERFASVVARLSDVTQESDESPVCHITVNSELHSAADESSVVSHLLDDVVNLDLKSVIRYSESSFSEKGREETPGDDVPEELRATKWLFYHFNSSYIASFEKFLQELSWNRHTLTDDIGVAFENLKAETFDGLVLPFDKIDDSSFKLLESIFLNRQVHIPAILMLGQSEANQKEFNTGFPHFPVSHFGEIPSNRKALVRLMRSTYDTVPNSNFQFFNELRSKLMAGVSKKQVNLTLQKDLLEDYQILITKSPLRYWCMYDELVMPEAAVNKSKKQDIYRDMEAMKPTAFVGFMTRCSYLLNANSDNNQLNSLEKEFWKLAGKNANHAASFAELLLQADLFQYLGRFLQNWLEDPKIERTAGYYYLCYLYYNHFGVDDTKMLGLFKAIQSVPRSWRYLHSLIQELVDSYSQTELQSLIQTAMKCSHADQKYCKLVIVESYYKTNNSNLGDRYLQEILNENPMNQGAREILVKYQRQNSVKVESA